jgi:transposase
MAVITPPKLPSMFINVSSNGKYAYVMTYKNIWDKNIKNSRRVGSKKVGSIIGGTKDGLVKFDDSFLEQYPELSKFKVSHIGKKFEFEAIDEDLYTVEHHIPTTALHAGATYALEHIVKSTPIWKALEDIFSAYALNKKILSIAYFMVLEKSNTMHYYDIFSERTRVPYQRVLNESSISRIFQNIKQDDIDKFFTKLCNNYISEKFFNTGKDLFLALDSTSISTYSENLSKAEFGKNKDGDLLRQVNVLMLVEQTTGLPIYYRLYNGAVPDVSTFRNTLATHARLNFNSNFIYVSDKGYTSINNINDSLRNNISFIFNTKVKQMTFVQECIDEHRAEFLDPNNYNMFIDQYVVTDEITWKYDAFPINGKRKSNTDSAKIFVHMYYDSEIYSNNLKTINYNLASVKNKILSGKSLFAIEQQLKDTYIEINPTTKELTINRAKVNEYVKYSGMRVLISDTVKDPITAYRAYQDRNSVEYAFNTLKSRLKCNRLRVSDNKSIEGKAFVQFLATSISIMVRNRLATYELLNKDAKDKFRLSSMSDNKVLQLLNNIMVTKFKDGLMFDEIVGTKKQLFKALNVPVPTVITSKELDNDEYDESLETETSSDLVDINEVII